jgi:hypothetical protein
MAKEKLHRNLTSELVYGFAVATINADAYDAMNLTERSAFMRRVYRLWGGNLEGAYNAKTNEYTLHQPKEAIT